MGERAGGRAGERAGGQAGERAGGRASKRTGGRAGAEQYLDNAGRVSDETNHYSNLSFSFTQSSYH